MVLITPILLLPILLIGTQVFDIVASIFNLQVSLSILSNLRQGSNNWICSSHHGKLLDDGGKKLIFGENFSDLF